MVDRQMGHYALDRAADAVQRQPGTRRVRRERRVRGRFSQFANAVPVAAPAAR